MYTPPFCRTPSNSSNYRAATKSQESQQKANSQRSIRTSTASADERSIIDETRAWERP
jgi:hypothetical protein